MPQHPAKAPTQACTSATKCGLLICHRLHEVTVFVLLGETLRRMHAEGRCTPTEDLQQNPVVQAPLNIPIEVAQTAAVPLPISLLLSCTPTTFRAGVSPRLDTLRRAKFD